MKIAICLPVHGDTRALFTYKLARMIALTHREWARLDRDDQPYIEILMAESSSVAENREWLSKEAEKIGAEWLLWLDSDQTFPADTLLRLLATGEPVIGANYPRRTDQALPTAKVEIDGQMATLWSTREKIEQGLIEPVACMGLGVCLVSAAALAALERPCFAGQNEDFYFFSKLREAGFVPKLDHRLSAEVGHLRIQELTNDHALSTLGRTAGSVDLQPGSGTVRGRLWG